MFIFCFLFVPSLFFFVLISFLFNRVLVVHTMKEKGSYQPWKSLMNMLIARMLLL